MNISKTLCQELGINQQHADSIITLIDDGNTIPFIARYRKELTGSMDDQVLRTFSERLTYLRSLEERKNEIIKTIDEQGKLTPELTNEITSAKTLAKVEDLYRPFKQKKKTRASVAKEKGLEPLALFILAQEENPSPFDEAKKYIKEDLPLEAAIKGAQDIIAEIISDSAKIRDLLRREIFMKGEIKCTGTKEEETVYSTYYNFSQGIKSLPSHRVLAIDRGEKEGLLKVSIAFPKERAIELIEDEYIPYVSPCEELMIEVILDSYTRLLFPSMEREARSTLSEKAALSAIEVFSENLKNLLLQPPVSGRVTLGLDPAYRTGCKIAVVDETGFPLIVDVIYPTPPQSKVLEAEAKVLKYIEKFNVDVIAIGNGTASRESELFIADVIKKYKDIGKSKKELAYMVVNEAGASVYSASKLAAKEFPDYDVSLRSAVSIARRLQDPLAELVKIDPKSIGVGQYQHDMPKTQLENALGGVVESCVNSVGVDLNTASPSLLSYVAGVSATTAQNIVTYREEKGRFKTRKELLKVSKLGPKAFLQCAGFLRIPAGKDVLDSTGVHPESYSASKKLLELCGYSLLDVESSNIGDLAEKVESLGMAQVSEKLGVGPETLADVIKELLQPGRDPREELEKPLLRSDVMDMKDLVKGMRLTGTVRNVIDFGAFVDIGVHQDGLVHISQICNKYINHPSEILKVGDIVEIEVIDVDAKKGRISLTMKDINKQP